MSSHATRLTFSMILMIAGSRAGAEDDYLQALEAEARKLSSPEQAALSPEKGNRERGDRERFEAELKKHKGTYSVYQKLLEKDRAEMFKRWREGAGYSELRHLIIKRSLHR